MKNLFLTGIETGVSALSQQDLWQEYIQEIHGLELPTKQQQENFSDMVVNNSFLSRVQEDGDKIIVFLSKRDLFMDREKPEEYIQKYGYLSFLVLTEDHKLKHLNGNHDLSHIIPAQLIKSAAIIMLPALNGQKVRISPISFQESATLDKAIEKVLKSMTESKR